MMCTLIRGSGRERGGRGKRDKVWDRGGGWKSDDGWSGSGVVVNGESGGGGVEVEAEAEAKVRRTKSIAMIAIMREIYCKRGVGVGVVVVNGGSGGGGVEVEAEAKGSDRGKGGGEKGTRCGIEETDGRVTAGGVGVGVVVVNGGSGGGGVETKAIFETTPIHIDESIKARGELALVKEIGVT
ncbi:hypothetical protein ACFE04_011096 [Oxalis oulophora]